MQSLYQNSRRLTLQPILRRRPDHHIFHSHFRSSSSQSIESPILVDVKGSKALVTFNNPKKGNSFTVDLQNAFIQHMHELSKIDSIRAIILTGKGKYFSTGMNLSAQGESFTSGNNTEQWNRLKDFLGAVSNSPKPVIALINGPCYGGGNGLAMACDIRIASHPDVSFTLSEVKVGVAPAVISKYIVREWGPGKAREAMMSGRSIPASELLPLGAVHRIAKSAEEAMAIADEYVALFEGNAPGAMAVSKQLVASVYSENDATHDKAANSAYLHFATPSEEAKIGIQAFREKRKPDWSVLWKQAASRTR